MRGVFVYPITFASKRSLGVLESRIRHNMPTHYFKIALLHSGRVCHSFSRSSVTRRLRVRREWMAYEVDIMTMHYGTICGYTSVTPSAPG